jgi:hypothetical protein
MRTLLSLGLLLALTTAARAADPALDRYLTAVRELAGILKGVKDKATADAARDKVVKLHETMVAAQKEMQKTEATEEYKKAVDDRIRKDMAPYEAEFARLSLVPDAFAVFADLDLFKMEAELYELHARLVALKIDVVVSIYKVKHGKYPADLKEGFQTLERDPLKDPWGREYQYDPAGPRSKAADPKADRPDVWVVSPYRGGKKLLGNWEDKK